VEKNTDNLIADEIEPSDVSKKFFTDLMSEEVPYIKLSSVKPRDQKLGKALTKEAEKNSKAAKRDKRKTVISNVLRQGSEERQRLMMLEKISITPAEVDWVGINDDLDDDDEDMDVQLRALAVDFGVPLRQFASNAAEVATDCSAFFALLLASLETEDSRAAFAADEQRLCYCRLRFAGLSAAQIGEYFWPSARARALVLAAAAPDGELFALPFEEAFLVAEPPELSVAGGVARLALDDLYRLASRCFAAKIRAHMGAYATPGRETLARSLAAELRRVASPGPGLTLAGLDERSARSFPPCMRRILLSLRRSRWLSFKGRFELSLFLKALGLDYFAQHAFWKERIWTPQEQWHFESQVVAGLKQIYGLDEAEEDYSPHRCVTIINHDCPANAQQVQGCPFAVMPKPELKVFLKALRGGVKHADIEALTAFVPGQPTKACVAFFNAKFPALPFKQEAFERPTDFFYESERRLNQ
jgi:hypothetical protein